MANRDGRKWLQIRPRAARCLSTRSRTHVGISQPIYGEVDISSSWALRPRIRRSALRARSGHEYRASLRTETGKSTAGSCRTHDCAPGISPVHVPPHRRPAEHWTPFNKSKTNRQTSKQKEIRYHAATDWRPGHMGYNWYMEQPLALLYTGMAGRRRGVAQKEYYLK